MASITDVNDNITEADAASCEEKQQEPTHIEVPQPIVDISDEPLVEILHKQVDSPGIGDTLINQESTSALLDKPDKTMNTNSVPEISTTLDEPLPHSEPDNVKATIPTPRSTEEDVDVAELADVEDDRVQTAPRSCIGEIFTEGKEMNGNGNVKNGRDRRSQRDTPTRPRDTHDRLFGQPNRKVAAPLMTDNIRSHIVFTDGVDSPVSRSPPSSKASSIINGSSGTSTPTRVMQQRRNPVTGDGIDQPKLRGSAFRNRGAIPFHYDPTLPEPRHVYYTDTNDDDFYPPKPCRSYKVHSYYTNQQCNGSVNPLQLLGFDTQDDERFKVESTKDPIPYDPYLLIGTNPLPTLFRFDLGEGREIPDYTPIPTPLIPGPHTLTGSLLTTKHTPGYLLRQSDEDFGSYAMKKASEGNPITGDGYKSMNGEINTSITALNSNYMPILHNRIPPGGYSSGLW